MAKRDRTPMTQLVFWREVATQLVINELERRGFNRADEALAQALATLESGAPSWEKETAADASGDQLLREFERMAVRAELLSGCGSSTAGGMACTADGDAICLNCGERVI